MQEDIQSLCTEYTDLSEEDQLFIREYASGLTAIAELSGADIFLDCLCRDQKSAIVVAEALRKDGNSLYQESVVGKRAEPEKEPGVFHAFETGNTCRELRAVTQENVPVQQNATPLYNQDGRMVAVLIAEKNIQDKIARNQKYERVSRTNERLQKTLKSLEQQETYAEDYSLQYMNVLLREMNHRIKNNLQMLGSMMSMDARRCQSAQARSILNKNVGRMLTVAAFHDMLSKQKAGSSVELKALLESTVDCVRTCIPPEGCQVDFVITGNDMVVSADLARALLLVVNELITNSVLHAFPGREHGRVEILLQENPPYRSLIIRDDGVGFSADVSEQRSLGLSIVEATVRDQIKGVLSISSGLYGSDGVSIRIDF